MVDLGWDVVDDEPELALASDCFRTLRCWNIANGPTAPFHDRIDQIKATIQDEIRRGEALQQQDVARAYAQLAALWHETVAFFDRGTTSSPAPSPSWRRSRSTSSTRPRSTGTTMSNYIDWMASCWRITVTGCPALSLPAGFDADGLPVGVQLVARQGADVGLLRAAKAVEEATGYAARRPPVATRVG